MHEPYPLEWSGCAAGYTLTNEHMTEIIIIALVCRQLSVPIMGRLWERQADSLTFSRKEKCENRISYGR